MILRRNNYERHVHWVKIKGMGGIVIMKCFEEFLKKQDRNYFIFGDVVVPDEKVVGDSYVLPTGKFYDDYFIPNSEGNLEYIGEISKCLYWDNNCIPKFFRHKSKKYYAILQSNFTVGFVDSVDLAKEIINRLDTGSIMVIRELEPNE